MEALLNLLVVLGPLTAAALLLALRPLPLRYFQGIYLLLGALWVLLHSLALPAVPLTALLLALLAGEVAHVVAVGLAGRHMGAANASSVLAVVGLFPWHLGFGTSVLYLLAGLLLTGVVSATKYALALRAHGLQGLMLKTSYVRKKLSPEAFEDFKRRASMVVAPPFALGAWAVLLLLGL